MLLHGQTNFDRMLWKFNGVFNPALQMADHARPQRYALPLPPPAGDKIDRRSLYVHKPVGRRARAIDDQTERFVEETRFGT